MDDNKIKEEKQKLKDFEILKQIIEGSENIEDLDENLKYRLLDLCDNRLVEVNKKIKETEKKIEKAEEILEKRK